MIVRFGLALRASVLALCLAGCGGEASVSREKTVPASGTVTYKGQPVADASISFVPDAPTVPGQAATGRGAFGRTDAQGKFTLMTFQSGDGAVPGTYKVTVAKTEAEMKPLPETGAPDYVDPESVPRPPAPKGLLPPKYANPATTDLKTTVVDSGPQEFKFELTD